MRPRAWIAVAVAVAALAGLWWLPVALPAAAVFSGGAAQAWSHRGLGDHGQAENSPAAVAAAAAQGFPGMELDIHYLTDAARLHVGHDAPAPGAARRYLDEFDLPDGMAVWLDVKNLDRLGEAEIADLAMQLRVLGLDRRGYIESPDLAKLRIAERHGLRTVYWMAPHTARWLPVLKYGLWMFGIDAVSAEAAHLDGIVPHFRGRSVFAFTVNDPAELARMAADPRIGVILTDRAYDRVSR